MAFASGTLDASGVAPPTKGALAEGDADEMHEGFVADAVEAKQMARVGQLVELHREIKEKKLKKLLARGNQAVDESTRVGAQSGQSDPGGSSSKQPEPQATPAHSKKRICRYGTCRRLEAAAEADVDPPSNPGAFDLFAVGDVNMKEPSGKGDSTSSDQMRKFIFIHSEHPRWSDATEELDPANFAEPEENSPLHRALRCEFNIDGVFVAWTHILASADSQAKFHAVLFEEPSTFFRAKRRRSRTEAEAVVQLASLFVKAGSTRNNALKLLEAYVMVSGPGGATTLQSLNRGVPIFTRCVPPLVGDPASPWHRGARKAWAEGVDGPEGCGWAGTRERTEAAEGWHSRRVTRRRACMCGFRHTPHRPAAAARPPPPPFFFQVSR